MPCTFGSSARHFMQKVEMLDSYKDYEPTDPLNGLRILSSLDFTLSFGLE